MITAVAGLIMVLLFFGELSEFLVGDGENKKGGFFLSFEIATIEKKKTSTPAPRSLLLLSLSLSVFSFLPLLLEIRLADSEQKQN